MTPAPLHPANINYERYYLLDGESQVRGSFATAQEAREAQRQGLQRCAVVSGATIKAHLLRERAALPGEGRPVADLRAEMDARYAERTGVARG